MHTDITHQFQQLYAPAKALLFYQHVLSEDNVYIEAFDCNRKGRLVNAHPLSAKELAGLADLFQRQSQHRDHYLYSEGLLPSNVLYLHPQTKYVIWQTPPQNKSLHFTKSLQLPNGKMNIPALIWKASKEQLHLFAISCSTVPQADTPLYHAPFFNMYRDGKVCMGTVNVKTDECTSLPHFIQTWQDYFFNSKFSHLIDEHRSTRTPLKQLYKKLLNQNQTFPQTELLPFSKTLQDILP